MRLAAICARGGSTGVKDKNIRPLAGKPLIAHTIEQARRSGLFETIAVSSDSRRILDIAGEWGVEHLIERPAELASNTAPKVPTIRHCAGAIEAATGTAFKTIVDLDVTAPLRSLDDIAGVVALLEETDAGNVVSGSPARKSPYFNIVERDDRGRIHISKPLDAPFARRQDLPECFELNASILAWRRAALFSEIDYALGDNTLIYVMPDERSVDIDSELDFQFVEFLIANKETTE